MTTSPMTTSDVPQKLRKAPIFTPYVVMWSTFGALSLIMLMVLGLAPEWLDDLRPGKFISDPQSNQGQRAAARLAADINGLKQSVSQVQLDLAQVKTDVAAHDEQQKTFVSHLSSIEQRLAPETTAANADAKKSPPAPPVSTTTPPKTVTLTPVRADAQTDTLRGYAAKEPTPVSASAAPPGTVGVIEPEPQAVAAAVTPKVINADTTALTAALSPNVAAAATGGTVNASADAISFGPAVVKPAAKPLGVKLSSGASVDSLRLSWSLLADKHGDTLKSMQARYVTGGDPGNPTYDLVAGPVKSKAEANKVCKSLTAAGVPCTIGTFAGEAL